MGRPCGPAFCFRFPGRATIVQALPPSPSYWVTSSMLFRALFSPSSTITQPHLVFSQRHCRSVITWLIFPRTRAGETFVLHVGALPRWRCCTPSTPTLSTYRGGPCSLRSTSRCCPIPLLPNVAMEHMFPFLLHSRLDLTRDEESNPKAMLVLVPASECGKHNIKCACTASELGRPGYGHAPSSLC